MYCKRCYKELSNNNLFCPACGAPVNDEVRDELLKHETMPNNLSRNKKAAGLAAAAISLMVFIIVIVCSVGESVVSKNEICNDIAEYSELDAMGMSIVTFDETKRDTDREDKYDHIWVNIEAKNDVIGYSASYYIVYGLYNDGWILESIELLDGDYYALETISHRQIEQDLKNYYTLTIAQYKLTNINVAAEIPEINKETKVLRISCGVTAENDEMSVMATVHMSYSLSMSEVQCGWILTYSEIASYSYKAKTKPSEALIAETTSSWTENFKLVSEEKVSTNTYKYIYEEHDEESFANVIVDWKNTLTYSYYPDQGGWKLVDKSYEVTCADLNVTGYWTYFQGNEYVKLNVLSASDKEITYDLDVAIVPTNIFQISNQPVTGSGTNRTKNWTYEYTNEGAYCLVFTVTEPVFTVSYGSGYYTDEYTLYYKAYIGEVMGKSGFYFRNYRLTLEE